MFSIKTMTLSALIKAIENEKCVDFGPWENYKLNHIKNYFEVMQM
jgi:hypothetical protein